MYIVRRAEIKDTDAILKLLLQVNMVHHIGRPDIFNGPVTKYNGEELAQIISNDETPVFVCEEENGQVAGHAFCIHKPAPDDELFTDINTLYIDDICVDENYRGKGIGRALYDHVLNYAKQNGFYNITLNVWECNPGAKKFYESLGMSVQKIGMEYIL